MNQRAPTPSFTERRSPRVPVSLPVVVEHGDSNLPALVINLGLGGAFVALEPGPRISYGAYVYIHLEVDEKRAPARLPGIVRWHDARGFGVQFLELGAKDTHALSRLMMSAGQ